MSDFLLELLSEEIPARMQAGARADLEKLFRRELEAAAIAARLREFRAQPARFGPRYLSGAEPLPDGRLRLPGAMAIQDAATALATEWETDATTVGGMVIEALGHLPTLGERISIGEYDFEVERLADRVVESVILVRLPTPRDEDEP